MTAATTTMSLMLLLPLLLLLTTTSSSSFFVFVDAAGAYQSGPNVGSLYSGGFSSSLINEDVFVTGISYAKTSTQATEQPSCFIARLDSLALQNPIPAAIIGNGQVLEACHAVDYLIHDTNSPRAVVVGNSDPGGLFGSQVSPSGFIMALDPSANFDVVTGMQLGNTRTTYPVKVIADESTNSVYITMTTSKTNILNPDAQTATAGSSDSQPNWLNDRRYGFDFFMSVQRVDFDPQTDEFKDGWLVEYPIEQEPDGTIPDVYVAGHIYKHSFNNPNAQANYNLIIVAGSTRGQGVGYGNAEGDDEDGYITIVSPTDGQPADINNVPVHQSNSNNAPNIPGQTNSAIDVVSLPSINLARNNERIGTAQDDILTGICDDPSSDDEFFVVGATKGGDMGDYFMGVNPANPESLQAWISKRRVSTLKREWNIQWGAYNPDTAASRGYTSVMATTCLVDPNGGYVYVAGVVENGGTVKLSNAADTTTYDDQISRPDGSDSNLQVTTPSAGGRDIWVAQLNKSTGDVNWLQQVGSDGDEALALGGGLELDDNGDLIVMGNTNGSLYRQRGASSSPIDDVNGDMFLMTFQAADGSFDPIGNTVPVTPTTPPAAGPTIPPDTADTVQHIEGTATLDWMLGLQSGPLVGPSYAGGMVYDTNNDAVFVTGITYDPTFEETTDDDTTVTGSRTPEPSCFVAKVSMTDGDVWDWEEWQIAGSPNIGETCSSLALHRNSELVIVGNGLLGSEYILNTDNGAAPGIAAGFTLAMSRTDLSTLDSHALLSEIPADKIMYPIDVLSNGNDLYIVSLASTDNIPNQESIAATSATSSPDWIGNLQYGTSWDMSVTKFTLREETINGISDGGITFTQVWSKEFPVDVDDKTGTTPRVYIGGSFITSNGNNLVVAGSTRGLGPAYGAAVDDDSDGFLATFDTSTGDFSSEVSRNTLREGSAEDDTVTGICPDPSDPTVFYAVGATKGTMGTRLSTLPMADGSLQGFIRKVDANTLRAVWTVQLGAVPQHDSADGSNTPTTVYARDCAVVDDLVYFGGDVLDDGGMVIGNDVRASYGGNDIWLAQASTADGSVNWLHQVGSSGDEHMAPNGGVVTVNSGNALVFGDTTGAVYRDRATTDITDLILMGFDKESGSYGDLTGTFQQYDDSPTPPTPVPTDPPVGAPTEAILQPVALQPTTITSNDPNAWKGNSGAPTEGLATGAIVGIVIAVLVVVGFFVYCMFCRRSRKRRRPTRSSKHLDAMSDNQIDFSVDRTISKDGLIISTSDASSSYKDTPSKSSSSTLSPRRSNGSGNGVGGLGGMLYSDEPLGGPNLQVGGYSDLKGRGKEVI